MTGRTTTAIVLGALGALMGIALIAGAATVLTLDVDDDGFDTTEAYRFERSSHAIVAEEPDGLADPPSWLIDEIRIQGTNTTGEALFIGIAATADVDSYLAGAAHHEITDLIFNNDSTIRDVEYSTHEGTTAPTAPGLQGFWMESVEGTGTQTLDWSLDSGNWTVVVMNADASTRVTADLAVGIRMPILTTLAWIALAVGVVSLLGGGYLAYRGLRHRSQPQRPTSVVDLRQEAPPVDQSPAREEPAART